MQQHTLCCIFPRLQLSANTADNKLKNSTVWSETCPIWDWKKEARHDRHSGFGNILDLHPAGLGSNRRRAPQVVAASAHTAPRYLDPSYVEGFLVPEQLSYHPGHSWAMQERRNLVRIGID